MNAAHRLGRHRRADGSALEHGSVEVGNRRGVDIADAHLADRVAVDVHRNDIAVALERLRADFRPSRLEIALGVGRQRLPARGERTRSRSPLIPLDSLGRLLPL